MALSSVAMLQTPDDNLTVTKFPVSRAFIQTIQPHQLRQNYNGFNVYLHYLPICLQQTLHGST